MRKLLLLGLLAACGCASAVALGQPAGSGGVAASDRAAAIVRARVTRVVDGDTLQVKYGRRTDRVRLIGIDTPEVGDCYASNATTAARKLAGARSVRLVGDPTQGARDRFRRLLAYVVLPSGRDLGRELLRAGFGVVYVYNKPFVRLAGYRAAEAAAKSASLGLWGTCVDVAPPPNTTTTTATTTTPTTTTTATTTTPTTTTSVTSTTTATTTTGGNCAPSYPDVCIPPPPPDLDCGDIPYRNFRVLYDVPSPDPHRFDGDRDGIGCES